MGRYAATHGRRRAPERKTSNRSVRTGPPASRAAPPIVVLPPLVSGQNGPWQAEDTDVLTPVNAELPTPLPPAPTAPTPPPATQPINTLLGDRVGASAPTDGSDLRDPLRRRSVDRRAMLGIAAAGAVGTSAAAVAIGPGHGLGLVGSDRSRPAAPAAIATGTRTGATRGRLEYQGSTGGKAPAVTKAPLRQPPTILSLDPAMHLARRATWGLTSKLVNEVKAGSTSWIESQLRPSTISDTSCDRLLRRFDTLASSPSELRAMNSSREGEDYFYAHTQLELAAIVRAIWSRRQLFELAVDFLHSRVHVPAHFDKSRDTLTDYDRNVIRKHAFGKFGDLVWASVTHPAMIVYLDNQNNTKDGGNQNLGRELLELHTLGVDAGYKQADVDGAARLLTGLSVDDEGLKTRYRSERHHVGSVRVLGKRYSNSRASTGMTTLKALVRDLTRHPKTAEYFAVDLVRRFVADAPPASLVKRLAAIYLAQDTAIVPMLRELFSSEEFAVSVGQKYRRPLENTVAAVRALGIGPGQDDKFVQALNDLRWNLESMGQAPLGHTAPDGYADYAGPWLSSLGTLARWNMQMSLTGSWREGLGKPDIDEVLSGTRTYGAAVDAMIARLLFQRPTTALRTPILKFLGKSSGSRLSSDARRNDYNLRVRAPALVLGAPHHQLR